MEVLSAGRDSNRPVWPGLLGLLLAVVVGWAVLAGIAFGVYSLLTWVWP